MCKELRKILKEYPHIFFNVMGGVGINPHPTESVCMGTDGIWFKFCPFCGRKIIKVKTELSWSWHEETFVSRFLKSVKGKNHIGVILNVDSPFPHHEGKATTKE